MSLPQVTFDQRTLKSINVIKTMVFLNCIFTLSLCITMASLWYHLHDELNRVNSVINQVQHLVVTLPVNMTKMITTEIATIQDALEGLSVKDASKKLKDTVVSQ